jgi:hypothetical protein
MLAGAVLDDAARFDDQRRAAILQPLPAPVATLIWGMTAVQPHHRYADMAAVRAAIADARERLASPDPGK